MEEQSWDDFVASLDEYDCDDSNLRYSDLESAAPAGGGGGAPPLSFPTPTVVDCVLTTVSALDHRNGQSKMIDNVLRRKTKRGGSSNSMSPDDEDERAYLIRKKVSKTTFGSLRFAVVLKKRQEPDDDDDQPSIEEVPWTSTDELVAVKISSWNKICDQRGQLWKDPVREVAALQLVGSYHPHIVGCHEVLQDDKHLYTVMPYYSGGRNLHCRLFADDHTDKKRDHNLPPPNEDEARYIFRQLLLGLFHLERKGIFHRDIALDNLLIDKYNKLKIVDLASSLRVPYMDPCNADCVTDVSEGISRRLMKKQSKGKGRLMYLAPELLDDKAPFDGFACDLWSAGICLFILLVGLAPFKCAQASEKRYHKISRGGLNGLLKSLNLQISPAACDLLQSMLWHDPRNRLTLIEVMSHPWVMGGGSGNTPPTDGPVSEEISTEQVQKMALSSGASISSASSKSTSTSTQNSKVDNSSDNSQSSSKGVKPEARQSTSEGSSRASMKDMKKFLTLPKNVKEITAPFNRKSFASTPVGSFASNDKSTTDETAESQTPTIATTTTNGKKLSPHRRAAVTGKQFLDRLKKKAVNLPTLPTTPKESSS